MFLYALALPIALPAQVLDRSCPTGSVGVAVLTPELLSSQSSAEDASGRPTMIAASRQEIGADIDGATSLTLLGPALGSMDARKLDLQLDCTPDGALLTATILRSAQATDPGFGSLPWRPKLRVRVMAGDRPVMFRATWKMRLTNGAPVKRAVTPTFPALRYPIELSAVVPARMRTR